MKKKCTLCEKLKDLSEFQKSSASKDGLQSRCRECRNPMMKEYMRKRYRDNPEKVKDSESRYLYGITLVERAELVEKQNGCCKICKKQITPLHVDHDHITGKVRGLLCSRCNLGLGQFDDNPDLLVDALNYLRSD